jgi:hypothetical protein
MSGLPTELTRYRRQGRVVPVPVILPQGNNRDVNKVIKPAPDFVHHRQFYIRSEKNDFLDTVSYNIGYVKRIWAGFRGAPFR